TRGLRGGRSARSAWRSSLTKSSASAGATRGSSSPSIWKRSRTRTGPNERTRRPRSALPTRASGGRRSSSCRVARGGCGERLRAPPVLPRARGAHRRVGGRARVPRHLSGGRAMTFLLQRCGIPARSLDIDAVWGALGEMVRDPDPPSPPGEETSDGARLGFVIGVRLALDDPGLARIVMGRYERCVNEDGEPYERDEGL